MNESVLSALVVLLLVVSVAALAVGLVALRRTTADARRLSRRNPATVPADLEGLRAEVQALRSESNDVLRHLAVVRYDAFGDMGGRLSWSLALLDDGGDGVVLTSIHGRSEARTYAKNVSSWASDQALSPEEQDVVGRARTA
jgi:hypothetical protein